MSSEPIAALPFSLIYNLNRLGQAGDQVSFSANEVERAAIARHVGALSVCVFDVRIVLTKPSPNRFDIAFALTADIAQACVVSLEPVAAMIRRDFRRELHFMPGLRGVEKDVTVSPDDDDEIEEVSSLHYDLAGPLIEEFVLALDPYPRAPGVEFAPPQEASDGRENPFAVLKTLKSGGESPK